MSEKVWSGIVPVAYGVWVGEKEIESANERYAAVLYAVGGERNSRGKSDGGWIWNEA